MPNTNLKFRFHPLADTDLNQAAAWYESKRIGLGYEFLLEFDRLKKYIKSFPKMFPAIENETRKASMGRFPYVVIYEVLKDEILIIAVFHTKRHPDYWKSRR